MWFWSGLVSRDFSPASPVLWERSEKILHTDVSVNIFPWISVFHLVSYWEIKGQVLLEEDFQGLWEPGVGNFEERWRNLKEILKHHPTKAQYDLLIPCPWRADLPHARDGDLPSCSFLTPRFKIGCLERKGTQTDHSVHRRLHWRKAMVRCQHNAQEVLATGCLTQFLLVPECCVAP